MSYASHDGAVTHDTFDRGGPTESDGDRLAKAIRNEIGRTFYATGGEVITGDQAFAQTMARASAAKRGR